MRKPLRKSLLSLAVAQAIGLGGAGWPGHALATNTPQPSAAAALSQYRDLRTELIELKNAVMESPDDAELRYRLGRLYLRIGDAPAAEKELTRARDLGLKDYDVLLALGEAWIAQGEFNRVFGDEVLGAAEEPAQRAALKVLQGQALQVEGRIEEARKHFSEALSLVDGYGPALLASAELELDAGNPTAAQQALSRAREAPDTNPVDLLRVEANRAFRLGDFEQAADYYRRALAERDGDQVLLRGLAVTQLRLDQPEQAMSTLNRLLAFSPKSADAIALKAQAALRLEDYRTAAELAGAVVGMGNDGRRIGALLTAGTASLLNGAPQQAREYLERYVALRQDDENAQRMLGQALLQLEDYREAYRVLAPLLDEARTDVPLLTALASAAAGVGNMTQAIEYLQRASALQPEDLQLKAQLAAARIGSEDRQLGLEQLDELIAQDESFALLAMDTALNRLEHGELNAAFATAGKVQELAPDALAPMLVQGVALLKGGQLDAAETILAKVLEQEPGNVAAKTGMAEILMRRGQVDEALSTFEALAAANPGDLRLQLNVAVAEVDAGRTLQAEQRLKQLLAQSPESVDARLALANLYILDARPDEALTVLDRAGDADNPALLLARARAHLLVDQPAEAVRILKPLVAQQPDSVPARLALAVALERSEDAPAARRALEDALAIAPETRAVRYELLRLSLLQPKIPAPDLTRFEGDALRFVQQQPTDPRSQVLRGLVLFRTEAQRDLALQGLRETLAANPSGELAALTADLHLIAGRADEAVEILQGYFSAHPADNYARLRLARAQLATGQYAAAADHLLSGIEAGARRPGLSMVTAWALATAGRHDEAARYLDQASAEGLSGPLMSHTQGLLRLRTGDSKGALSALQQAVDESAGRPSARLRIDLARALSDTGDSAQARRLLQGIDTAELNAADRDVKQAVEARLR